MFRALLGGSVSMVEGTAHARLRWLLGPLFTRQRVMASLPRVVSAFEQTATQWPHQAPVDLFVCLGELTIRSVGAILIDDPALWQSDSAFSGARARTWAVMNDLALCGLQPTGRPDDQHVLGVTDGIETLRTLVAGKLRQPSTRPDDIISHLAALCRRGLLSLSEAVNQLFGLLMAAHETSAGCLLGHGDDGTLTRNGRLLFGRKSITYCEVNRRPPATSRGPDGCGRRAGKPAPASSGRPSVPRLIMLALLLQRFDILLPEPADAAATLAIALRPAMPTVAWVRPRA